MRCTNPEVVLSCLIHTHIAIFCVHFVPLSLILHITSDLTSHFESNISRKYKYLDKASLVKKSTEKSRLNYFATRRYISCGHDCLIPVKCILLPHICINIEITGMLKLLYLRLTSTSKMWLVRSIHPNSTCARICPI